MKVANAIGCIFCKFSILQMFLRVYYVNFIKNYTKKKNKHL